MRCLLLITAIGCAGRDKPPSDTTDDAEDDTAPSGDTDTIDDTAADTGAPETDPTGPDAVEVSEPAFTSPEGALYIRIDDELYVVEESASGALLSPLIDLSGYQMPVAGGGWLAALSEDGQTARVWDPTSGALEAELALGQPAFSLATSSSQLFFTDALAEVWTAALPDGAPSSVGRFGGDTDGYNTELAMDGDTLFLSACDGCDSRGATRLLFEIDTGSLTLKADAWSTSAESRWAARDGTLSITANRGDLGYSEYQVVLQQLRLDDAEAGWSYTSEEHWWIDGASAALPGVLHAASIGYEDWANADYRDPTMWVVDVAKSARSRAEDLRCDRAAVASRGDGAARLWCLTHAGELSGRTLVRQSDGVWGRAPASALASGVSGLLYSPP